MNGIDQDKAHRMLGRIVLAGITSHDREGNILNQTQVFGRVLRINAQEGVVLANGIDGTEIALPPDLAQYSAAEPGTYTLRSTNTVVHDPDYLSSWDIHPPSGSKGDAG
ncbi:hypothetical protein [Stenotrophomonas sp.]|uniref:hypothetical protein n=1 Tax=Stenotrophomonas sp. TaxID=69392 RepID=UPI0028A82896|nr:hypothetical protein [Stenotrophomonas sp.]